MRRFIHWFFYLSLLSLFGMLSFHAHAQTSTCRTTRDQWVVQVPYAIGYAPGTADWTPISAPIQSTGADFYSCDGGNDAWRSIGFVDVDNPVGTVVGEDGASRHVYKTQIDGIGYALGFREQQYCGADAIRYIDGTSQVNGNESRRICDASQNPAFASASTSSSYSPGCGSTWFTLRRINRASPSCADEEDAAARTSSSAACAALTLEFR